MYIITSAMDMTKPEILDGIKDFRRLKQLRSNNTLSISEGLLRRLTGGGVRRLAGSKEAHLLRGRRLDRAVFAGGDELVARGQGQRSVGVLGQRSPDCGSVGHGELRDERLPGNVPLRAVLHDDLNGGNAVVPGQILHMPLEEILVDGVGPEL